MLYLIYMVNYLKSLTLGELIFTLMWAWDTRKEMTTDWLTHIETAMDRAMKEAEENGLAM